MKKIAILVIMFIMVYVSVIPISAYYDRNDPRVFTFKIPDEEKDDPQDVRKVYTVCVRDCRDIYGDLQSKIGYDESYEIQLVCYSVLEMPLEAIFAKEGRFAEKNVDVESLLAVPIFISNKTEGDFNRTKFRNLGKVRHIPDGEFFLKYYDKGEKLLNSIGVIANIRNVYCISTNMIGRLVNDCIVFSTDKGEYVLFSSLASESAALFGLDGVYFMSMAEFEEVCVALREACENHLNYDVEGGEGYLNFDYVQYLDYDLTPYEVNEEYIMNASDDYLIAGGASTTLAAVGSVTPAYFLGKRRKKHQTEA